MDDDTEHREDIEGGEDTEGSEAGVHIVKLRGLPFSTKKQDVVEFLSGVNIRNGLDGKIVFLYDCVVGK